jgi:hypothetical protein
VAQSAKRTAKLLKVTILIKTPLSKLLQKPAIFKIRRIEEKEGACLGTPTPFQDRFRRCELLRHRALLLILNLLIGRVQLLLVRVKLLHVRVTVFAVILQMLNSLVPFRAVPPQLRRVMVDGVMVSVNIGAIVLYIFGVAVGFGVL